MIKVYYDPKWDNILVVEIALAPTKSDGETWTLVNPGYWVKYSPSDIDLKYLKNCIDLGEL